MIDAWLEQHGLEVWAEAARALLEQRLSPDAHGDYARWRAAVDALPELSALEPLLDQDAVTVPVTTIDDEARSRLVASLRELMPWRKGPFRIADIDIDTEWRSDLKWRRIAGKISPLTDRRVLDVGCGNGYYALRMLGDDAGVVVGIDPTLLFSLQFAAINRYVGTDRMVILPCRDDELPLAGRVFDTAFSMGVLYHQRSPIDHLTRLRRQLRQGGELVLETIVLPGDDAFSRTPPDRYARMRNVWHLPTVPELLTWLERAGYRDAEVIDLTLTTVDEQRTTEWMSFESLAEALDPGNAALTVEGWPAPLRASVRATAP